MKQRAMPVSWRGTATTLSDSEDDDGGEPFAPTNESGGMRTISSPAMSPLSPTISSPLMSPHDYGSEEPPRARSHGEPLIASTRSTKEIPTSDKPSVMRSSSMAKPPTVATLFATSSDESDTPAGPRPHCAFCARLALSFDDAPACAAACSAGCSCLAAKLLEWRAHHARGKALHSKMQEVIPRVRLEHSVHEFVAAARAAEPDDVKAMREAEFDNRERWGDGRGAWDGSVAHYEAFCAHQAEAEQAEEAQEQLQRARSAAAYDDQGVDDAIDALDVDFGSDDEVGFGSSSSGSSSDDDDEPACPAVKAELAGELAALEDEAIVAATTPEVTTFLCEPIPSVNLVPPSKALAAKLMHAWTDRRWLGRADYPSGAVRDLQQVYRVHEACVAHPMASDPRLGGVAGYKQGGIGAVQGNSPDFVYGILWNAGLVDARDDGAGAISKGRSNLFGLEAEIGFLMARDLPPPTGDSGGEGEGRARTEEEVFAAVGEVVLCIECCGSRLDPELFGSASSLEKLADASCAGGVVMGARFAPSRDATGADGGVTAAELRLLSAAIDVDGERKAAGDGAANPEGSPVASLTGCANHLNSRGLGLLAGQLVIGGAFCKTRDFGAGSDVRVSFRGEGRDWGAVGARITE